MIFLSLTFIGLILFCIRGEKILNFSSFLLVSILYLICYGFFPLVFFLIDKSPASYSGAWLNNIRYSKEANLYLYYYATILSIISYLSFLLAYKISSFKKKALFENYIVTQNFKKYYKIGKWFLFSGGFFLIAYIALFGSVNQMLLGNKRMTYSGHEAVEVESSFTFFIMLAKILIFSSYMLWGVKQIKDVKFNGRKILFYLSLIFGLFVLFRFSGRLILVTYVLTFFLSKFILDQKVQKTAVAILGGFVGFVLLFGSAVFRLVIYEDALDRRIDKYEDSFMTPILDIIGSFSFPYFNIVHNLYLDHNKYLYFLDILQFPLYVLPTKLFPFAQVDSTIVVNTYNMIGIKGGIIPPDIVTYGYLNFGLIGVVLIAVIFGIVCKYIDSFIKVGGAPISVIILIALIFIISFRVMYFDPRQLVRSYFYFFMGLLILRAFAPKIKKQNKL